MARDMPGGGTFVARFEVTRFPMTFDDRRSFDDLAERIALCSRSILSGIEVTSVFGDRLITISAPAEDTLATALGMFETLSSEYVCRPVLEEVSG